MDIARPKKYKVDTVKRWRREGRGYAGAEGCGVKWDFPILTKGSEVQTPLHKIFDSKWYVLVHSNALLSRVSILTRDIDIGNLSVCLFLTFRYQMKTA